MKEISYMEYAEFMEKASSAFGDILNSGLLVPEIARAHGMETDEVKLLQDGVYRGCGFWLLFSELCVERFGVDYVKQWERRKRFVNANKDDADYANELELLQLQGNVLGPLRLLYGDEIRDIREMILRERDKNKLRDLAEAVHCCTSLTDFIEYMGCSYNVNIMLYNAQKSMDMYLRDANDIWD